MGKVMTSDWGRSAAALLAGGLAFSICSSAAAEIGASPWQKTERAMVRLVAAASAVGRSDEILVGVEMRMQPGWKTYWRHPGEAGLPPRFNWQGSANIAAQDVIWPTPERFAVGGVESIGYTARVILPIRLKLAAPGRAAAMKLHLAYAVCREICVPDEATLSLALPVGNGARTAHAGEIARFAALAPRPGGAHGWHVEYAGHELPPRPGAAPRSMLMVTLVSGKTPFGHPDLLVVGETGEHYGRAALRVIDMGRRVHFILPHTAAASGAGEKGREILLTVIDGARSGEFTFRVGGAEH